MERRERNGFPTGGGVDRISNRLRCGDIERKEKQESRMTPGFIAYSQVCPQHPDHVLTQ